MRKRLHLLFLMLLITSNVSLGRDSHKSKLTKETNGSQYSGQQILKSSIERIKRSTDDEEDKPFWANRGKKQSEEVKYSDQGYKNNIKSSTRMLKAIENEIEKELPFWGNRGRRDSLSDENYVEDINFVDHKDIPCKLCSDNESRDITNFDFDLGSSKGRRDEISPFWGNRGRRNSEEVFEESHDPVSSFWHNRGRREEDEPFWGNRGRREDDLPFWGNRGRRENVLPFWRNRGRRESLSDLQYTEVKDSEPFWGNRGRRRDLKQSIRNAIKEVEENIENQANTNSNPKSFESTIAKLSFWNNQDRVSSLKHLFTNYPRNKYEFIHPAKKALGDDDLRSQSKTVLDDRIFAEEPHYIIVERSSRSSSEIDPFIISRGKKKTFHEIDLAKAARDRRGAIEDIVKSVKSDPYFIVRGKKRFGGNDTRTSDKSSANLDEVAKAKDLICATIEFLLSKNKVNRLKREGNESDRGRRATLKKLAAQLNMDPYFVSRGKKTTDTMNEIKNLVDFMSEVGEICNY